MSRSSEYNTWNHLIQRCTNPKDEAYHNYGGRGIKVCKRWFSFENFLEDMGHRPKGKELDREDNNKGYNKKNCRWVSSSINANNRRNNLHIVWKRKSKTLNQWAHHLGIKYKALWDRLYKLGWSINDAFTK